MGGRLVFPGSSGSSATAAPVLSPTSATDVHHAGFLTVAFGQRYGSQCLVTVEGEDGAGSRRDCQWVNAARWARCRGNPARGPTIGEDATGRRLR
jgi:hypothetical protein